VLNRGCKRVSPNNDIGKWLLDMQSSWSKNAFWGVNNKKWHKWCKFVSYFLYNYGLPVFTMDTKRPNQVFIMFDLSIYRLFVLNGGWKLTYLQIMLFVHACSTWSIVELKTRFETWITRNDVNGVNLIHLYTLITHMLTCAHNWHQLSNSSILYLIGRTTYILC
jgi:hypothetical protein